jgi:glycosyltransferase involved in cell wall biosynthesis
MTVSVISACGNRGKALAVSISSWIQFDEIDEIIVTDWNSTDPIFHLTELDSRIKVITVKNEPYFNQPQPLNLAASLVKTDNILKLDSDTVMNPYFNFFLQVLQMCDLDFRYLQSILFLKVS